MARSRRMSAHKRLRERRKAQQAELKCAMSPAGFAETEVERELVLLPLADPR